MSHDLEYNFIEEYENEEKQCQHCDSFENKEGKYFCNELRQKVLPVGHCDFFRSKN